MDFENGSPPARENPLLFPRMVFSLSHLYCITFCGYCKQFFGFFTSNFVTYEQTVNFSGEITVFLSNLLTPSPVYAKINLVGGHFGAASFCLFSTNTNRLTTNAASRFFVYLRRTVGWLYSGVVTYSEDAKSQFFRSIAKLYTRSHSCDISWRRNFARQGKASEEDEAVVTYGNSTESTL